MGQAEPMNIESFDCAQDKYRTPMDTLGAGKEFRILRLCSGQVSNPDRYTWGRQGIPNVEVTLEKPPNE